MARVPTGQTTEYLCAWCGEPGELPVDPSGGRRQRLVEDCWVCCRPNVLTLVLGEHGDATLTADPEGG